jgi:hypothetical protein
MQVLREYFKANAPLRNSFVDLLRELVDKAEAREAAVIEAFILEKGLVDEDRKDGYFMEKEAKTFESLVGVRSSRASINRYINCLHPY